MIGESTASEAASHTLVTLLKSGLVSQSTHDDPLRVLVLTNQAGKPFITAGSAFPLELLELSGAESLSHELGIQVTGPISAEHIVQSNPDGIVLIDMNGTGDRMYTSLLENPAVAALPAVADDQLLRVEGRQVQAMGLTATIDGLANLSSWVEQLR